MSHAAGRLAQRHANTGPLAAQSLLAPEHPLASALEDRQREGRRLLAVMAMLVGGSAAAVTGTSDSSLLVAAVIAMVAFACRFAPVGERIRGEARQAIIDGRHHLPLDCVQAERDRLAQPRVHAHLAQWAQGLTCTTDGWSAPPLWSVTAVRAVRSELRDVALLLRTGHTGLRGVAMLEHLVTSGELPQYGDDPRPLAEELGRIRYHLSAVP
jgi:hypothetical protein